MPADGWLGTDVRTAALCLYAPVEDSSENTKFVHAGVCPNKHLKNHIQDYLMKNSSLFFVTIRTAALRSANSVGYGKKKKNQERSPTHPPPEAALYWPNTQTHSESTTRQRFLQLPLPRALLACLLPAGGTIPSVSHFLEEFPIISLVPNE